MKKIIITAVLPALLTALFCGCNAGVITNQPSSETAAATTQTVTAEHTEKETETTKEEQITTQKITESATETTAIPTTKVSTTKKETTTEKKKEKTTAKTTTEKTLTCTITIECRDIFENIDDLKDGHEAYLPKDGYFVKNHTVTFENYDTVYDILKTTAKQYGLKITVKDTAFGKYISDINNIGEKDAGPTSGWTYYVNGEFAQYSCAKYKVKNGDRILFTYSCHE